MKSSKEFLFLLQLLLINVLISLLPIRVGDDVFGNLIQRGPAGLQEIYARPDGSVRRRRG